ncbi:MAG: hypothetical protein JNM55_20925 [Anaerolineales bacterium]|nr:hypothetical protein [Anaerolineales bacterium]
MGASILATTQLIQDLEKKLKPLRRALHGNEQLGFDEMMNSLVNYRTAIANASSEENDVTDKDDRVATLDTLHPIDLMYASMIVEAFTRIIVLQEQLAEQNGTGLMKVGR